MVRIEKGSIKKAGSSGRGFDAKQEVPGRTSAGMFGKPHGRCTMAVINRDPGRDGPVHFVCLCLDASIDLLFLWLGFAKAKLRLGQA